MMCLPLLDKFYVFFFLYCAVIPYVTGKAAPAHIYKTGMCLLSFVDVYHIYVSFILFHINMPIVLYDCISFVSCQDFLWLAMR